MATDELLRQILADPTDTAVRSVYADALMVAGDPRGELIALEESGCDPVRRAALREAHAQAWWGRPAHLVKSERGFAVGVATTWAELRADTSLFAREPIEEIELYRSHDQGLLPVAQLLAAPRLRRLAVRGVFERGALLSVIRGPLSERLESLDVTGAMTRVEPLEHLPHCRRLVLARCPLGRTLTTLLRWEHLGQLEELDVRSCGLDAWTLDELLALDLRSLRILRLSGNPLGDRGTEVLQRRLRHLPRLERLELVDCEVTDITHAAITEREDLPATIDLFGTTLELVPTTAGRYGVLVDGVRRPLVFRRIRTEDGEPATITERSEGLDAPLEPLYQALALGVNRTVDATGAWIDLGREVAFAYARAITTREAVVVRFGDPLELALNRHVENDD